MKNENEEIISIEDKTRQDLAEFYTYLKLRLIAILTILIIIDFILFRITK